MAADNWGICPRCLKNEVKERQKLDNDVQEQYGKIPQDKYLELVEKAKAPQKPLERTLREDYEIETDEDGVFSVSYQCSCSKCGYSATFKHEEILTKV